MQNRNIYITSLDPCIIMAKCVYKIGTYIYILHIIGPITYVSSVLTFSFLSQLLSLLVRRRIIEPLIVTLPFPWSTIFLR